MPLPLYPRHHWLHLCQFTGSCLLALALLAGTNTPGFAQDRTGGAWSYPIRVAQPPQFKELRAAPEEVIPEILQPSPAPTPAIAPPVAPAPTPPMAPAPTPAAGPASEPVRPLNDRLKPIGDVRSALQPREAIYPVDHAAIKFSEADALASEVVVQRTWGSRLYSWDATAFCHGPLYFEDENLERHGRSFGMLQPAVSAGHFTAHFLAWPYLIGATPPRRCVYNLGREPPGTYTPYKVVRPPLSLRGAISEAGAVVALPFIVP